MARLCFFLLFASSFTAAYAAELPAGKLSLLIGTDTAGRSHNQPAEWPPEAGTWNAKTAVYSRAANAIAFYSFRNDITGGSIRPGPGAIRAKNVPQYFQAGPATGPFDRSGTAEIYLARPDGTNARCMTCRDLADGENGVTLYQVLPSSTSTPNALVRQTGAAIYANQNKDLATWFPDGKWLIVAVEMPRHALTHDLGVSEKGQYNDLWAMSIDGKTWVQLTDFASTWSLSDPVAVTPYACSDNANCASGCQYVGAVTAPFDAYWCSARNDPPPASGTMRPRMSNAFSGTLPGSARLLWGEYLGTNISYALAGVLQLAAADVVINEGAPALVNYTRNITPTPAAPSATSVWSNPGGNTMVGTFYEAWPLTPDDQLALIATDAFFSSPDPAFRYGPSTLSAIFPDVGEWDWRPGAATLSNVTRYDAAYAYETNAAPPPFSKYGHWEEPALAFDWNGSRHIAFASSANLSPPFDPLRFAATFGVDTWIIPQDRKSPAKRITFFNDANGRSRAYPTAWNGEGSMIYLTVTVGSGSATNPMANVYVYQFAVSRRRAVGR